LGGVVGIALAIALTRGLLALVPTDGQPLTITAQPDLRILGFTLGLTFATGIIFGLLPALRASRPDPWTTLKDAVGAIAGTSGSLFLMNSFSIACDRRPASSRQRWRRCPSWRAMNGTARCRWKATGPLTARTCRHS
jgi:hypothetical protein